VVVVVVVSVVVVCVVAIFGTLITEKDKKKLNCS
jgi:hypothetical protein